MNNVNVNEMIKSYVDKNRPPLDNDIPFLAKWERILDMLTVKTRCNKDGICRIISNRRDRSYNILGLNVLRCWLANESEMRKAGYFMTYSKKNGIALYYKHN